MLKFFLNPYNSYLSLWYFANFDNATMFQETYI